LCCAATADVLTIENSRSGDEMVRALVAANYGKDVGPGVYDVHSPVVPTVDFMAEKVKTFIAAGLLKVRVQELEGEECRVAWHCGVAKGIICATGIAAASCCRAVWTTTPGVPAVLHTRKP
jgi:hypothetical protein